MSFSWYDDFTENELKTLWSELPFQEDSSDEEDLESIPNNVEVVVSLPRVLVLNVEPTSSSSAYNNALDVFAAAFSRTICAISTGIAARQRYLDGLSTQAQDSNNETASRASWLRLVASADRQNNLADETFPAGYFSVQTSPAAPIPPAAPTPRGIILQAAPASSPRPILGRWEADGSPRPLIMQVTPLEPPRRIRGRRLTISLDMSNPHSNNSMEVPDSSLVTEQPLVEDGDNALKEQGDENGFSSPLIEHNSVAGDGDNASKEEGEENGISSPLIEQPLAEDGDNVSKEEGEEKGISSPLIEQPSAEDGDNVSEEEEVEKGIEEDDASSALEA